MVYEKPESRNFCDLFARLASGAPDTVEELAEIAGRAISWEAGRRGRIHSRYRSLRGRGRRALTGG